MNLTTRSLDGAIYYKHFNTYNIVGNTINLTSTLDLPLPSYKNGFEISFILNQDVNIKYIKIDKLPTVKAVGFFKEDITETFKTNEFISFYYDGMQTGYEQFVLKESRYGISDINSDITNINTQINVIQDSMEVDIAVNKANHGFNVQPVRIDTSGNIVVANSTSGIYANALVIPVDVDNYIVKTSGRFKVPISFQDIYGASVSVNASYYLSGTKLSTVNPFEGKVQTIFDTYMYNNTVYGVLTLNNPIIEYIVDF